MALFCYFCNNMKAAYIFLADGFEEIEALATNDVLRRGGVVTKLVSLTDDPTVVSSHGVTLQAELSLRALPALTADDVMIFPGGMPGSKNLAACTELTGLMKKHHAAGGTVAAICAAPGLVLSQLDADALAGASFTCFEGFQDALLAKGAVYTPAPAVRSGRIVTGRSAGHAVAFGLEILRGIRGDACAEEVRHAMFLD